MVEGAKEERDYGKGRLAVWIPIVLAVGATLGSGVTFLINRHDKQREKIAEWTRENDKLIGTYLIPIQSALGEARKEKDYLDKNFSYLGTGVLESYIYYARAHGGTGSDQELKSIQHILRLNEDMRVGIKTYLPCALTDDYKIVGQKTVGYLDIYLDRATTIERLAKTNEDVPRFDLFPTEFVGALSKEIAARKKLEIENSPQSCLPS